MKQLTAALVGVLVLAAGALAFQSYLGQKDAEWHERVERETARAETLMAENEQLRTEAAELEAIADSALIAATERDTIIVNRIETLPAPTPDCEVFTAPRDSLIADMQGRHDKMLMVTSNYRNSLSLLHAAEAKARASTDSLLAVLDDRPKPRSPLIPEVGLGCAAGLSVTTGTPDAACGLSLSWKVRLF
jgi:hypothetical protein